MNLKDSVRDARKLEKMLRSVLALGEAADEITQAYATLEDVKEQVVKASNEVLNAKKDLEDAKEEYSKVVNKKDQTEKKLKDLQLHEASLHNDMVKRANADIASAKASFDRDIDEAKKEAMAFVKMQEETANLVMDDLAVLRKERSDLEADIKKMKEKWNG